MNTKSLNSHSSMSCPTPIPLFNDSSQSSQGISNSGSSRQRSSTGYVSSSLDRLSKTAESMANSAQHNSNHDANASSAVSQPLRNQTTRDLISIFEQRIPSQVGPASPLSSHPLQRRPIKETPLPCIAPPNTFKSNPLRDSFRNLLTVFNKAKKNFAENPSVGVRRRNGTSVKPPNTLGGCISSCSDDVPVTSRPTLSHLPPGLPSDIRNGVLLYYDQGSNLPVWHRCDAFLAPPHLRLDYFTTSGKPAFRTISIVGGIDSRSIASTTCAAVTPPLLGGKPPYVFEIEFQDGRTEKLAAASVLERGGWISSLWDSILSEKLKYSSKDPDTISTTLLSLPVPPTVEDLKTKGGGSQVRPNKDDPSCENTGNAGSTSLSTQESVHSTNLSWTTTDGSFPGSPSMHVIRGMSIVKQRLAKWDGAAVVNGSPSSLSTNLEHLRTPTPPSSYEVSSAMLSRNPGSQQTTSSMGCELASPRPIRAMVSSLLSSTDTGSSYEGVSELERSVSGYDRAKNDVGSETAIDSDRNPILPSTPPSISVKLQRHDISSRDVSISKQSYSPNEALEELSGSQERTISNLNRKLTQIHAEMKLAIQQPSLPVPQLDELRYRLKAMADGLHAADIQGLHSKLDDLKEKAKETVLRNETPGSNDDILKKLNNILHGFDELRTEIKNQKSSLSLIKIKLEAIGENFEGLSVPPPVPLKNEPPQGPSALQEHIDGIQKRLGTLEGILMDIRRHNEEANTPSTMKDEPPESFSVFSKRSSVRSSTSQSNQIPKEICEILALLKDGQQEKSSISSQFEDSVRYLNELNGWMEAFVAKTSAQEQILQKIAENMEDVVQDPTMTMHNLSPDSQGLVGSGETLADLKANMQGVLRAIEDDMRQHAEFRETQGLTAVLLAIEMNQKEQGNLLRSIAEGISADVRGERLRFVDAMKDATSVNVAMHLEEFKRQLSLEVTNMLQEVGRGARCRERNYLEKEIGEIFNQQVERRQSIGFQALAARAAPPSRPPSEGPYPAFMMPPGMRPMSQSTLPMYPMTLQPSISGTYIRPLPTPSMHGGPSPQPVLNTSQMAPPHRRKA